MVRRLLVGGLVVGALTGKSGYEPIQPFYEGMFRGALTLFLLEMGLLAAERLGDLRRTGPFLVAFGVAIPVLHGALGAWAGTIAGLSPGGAAVLGAMAASASYIAGPPAVRMTLPEANPTYYLTCSLAITLPVQPGRRDPALLLVRQAVRAIAFRLSTFAF